MSGISCLRIFLQNDANKKLRKGYFLCRSVPYLCCGSFKVFDILFVDNEEFVGSAEEAGSLQPILNESNTALQYLSNSNFVF